MTPLTLERPHLTRRVGDNSCGSMALEPRDRQAELRVCKPKPVTLFEKVFLSDQCKEIEENSRTGKTRDFFKKIRDTKGTFHAKMGSIKDRNGMDLTE